MVYPSTCLNVLGCQSILQPLDYISYRIITCISYNLMTRVCYCHTLYIGRLNTDDMITIVPIQYSYIHYIPIYSNIFMCTCILSYLIYYPIPRIKIMIMYT